MNESNRPNLEVVESTFDIAYSKVYRALALCDVMAIAAAADGELFDDTPQILAFWLVDELHDAKAALHKEIEASLEKRKL